MFWITVIVWAVMYIAAVALLLVFFAGAANGNDGWDKANAEFEEARWQEKSTA